MPGIDGSEMIRRLRADPQLQELDIVVVSGLTEEEILENGGLPPDVIFYNKPVPFRERRAMSRLSSWPCSAAAAPPERPASLPSVLRLPPPALSPVVKVLVTPPGGTRVSVAVIFSHCPVFGRRRRGVRGIAFS